jgi:putative aldouronate transport system permease protein
MSVAEQTTPGGLRMQKKRRRRWGMGDVKRHITYLLMFMPGFLFLLVFNYIPMPGLILAFKDFVTTRPPRGHWLQQPFLYSLFIDNKWVGFDNFAFIFNTPDAWLVIRNTLGYSLTFMIVGLFFTVGLALMISELRQKIAAKIYHTIIFLPFFISWIVVSYVVYGLFASNGIFNQVLRSMNAETAVWYNMPGIWPFIYVIANVWRYTGNGAIIYLATLTGFDQQLYEAAAIDGAGKWQQMLKITLPQLVPIIVLLQILAVGRRFSSDLDMFWSLRNGSGPLRDVSLTIDVYVMNGIRSGMKFSMTAAADLFKNGVGFVMVLGTNLIVRKTAPELALF